MSSLACTIVRVDTQGLQGSDDSCINYYKSFDRPYLLASTKLNKLTAGQQAAFVLYTYLPVAASEASDDH